MPIRPSPRVDGQVGELEHVERGLLVGVGGAQGGDDGGALAPREHHLQLGLGDPLQLPDLADRRVRAGQRLELAGAGGRERAVAVVADAPAPAAASASCTAVIAGPTGMNVTILSSGGLGAGSSGPWTTSAERRGEGVGDAGVGGVGVGVRGEQRGAAPDEPVHQRALRRVRADAVHPAQQQRVVGEQQLRAAVERLVDGAGTGSTATSTLDTLSAGSPQTSPTASQSCGERGRIGRLERGDHVGEPGAS